MKTKLLRSLGKYSRIEQMNCTNAKCIRLDKLLDLVDFLLLLLWTSTSF